MTSFGKSARVLPVPTLPPHFARLHIYNAWDIHHGYGQLKNQHSSALVMVLQACLQLPIDKTGKCNAIAFWFELELDEETQLSTSPYCHKVSPSACYPLSVCCLSVRLSVSLSVYPSVCLSVDLSICLSLVGLSDKSCLCVLLSMSDEP